jgi:hypothetical protein
MSTSAQLARQWWDTLHPIDRQRVWDSRHSYLAGDLVESMANAGVPVVSDGRWSCISIGPTGFTVPDAVQQLPPGTNPNAPTKTTRTTTHRTPAG